MARKSDIKFDFFGNATVYVKPLTAADARLKFRAKRRIKVDLKKGNAKDIRRVLNSISKMSDRELSELFLSFQSIKEIYDVSIKVIEQGVCKDYAELHLLTATRIKKAGDQLQINSELDDSFHKNLTEKMNEFDNSDGGPRVSSNMYVFKLSYDSKSTADNAIDAAILGNSLLNMSALIKESAKVLNGEDADARVEVKAHEPGSFIVEFVAWLNEGGIDVLRALGITSTTAAAGLGNVFSALKALQNRKQIEKSIKDGNTTLLLEDGEKITIPTEVDTLISTYSVRTKLEQIVKKASESEASATVKILSGNNTVVQEIDNTEAKFFKAPPRKLLSEEMVTNDVINVVFSVVALESKTGWRIKLPNGNTVSATMNDDAFIERINKRERVFIKGDLFEIELKTVETTVDGNTTVKRSIERVIRHRVDESKKVI